MAQKLSLQEQLLKAGLVTAAKAKQVKSEKHKEAKLQQHNNVQKQNEALQLAQQAKAEQLAKDLELSAKQQEQAEKKAIAAQIRQLIEQNRKADWDGDITYRFTEKNRVKTIFVNETAREQLSLGSLAIVKLDKRYELVAPDIAEKIGARDPNRLLFLCNKSEDKTKADDPYAAFQVPDDLMW